MQVHSAPGRPPHGAAQQWQAEIRRLKSHFLAGLNHEIRTPLTGILGMTDLLLETPLDDVQREYVMTTRICAEELLELLDAALEYSALSSGALFIEEAEFNLPELLEGVLDQHRIKAHAKGLKLVAHLDSLPAVVIGDAVRIRKIVSQLLSNAVKFTPSGEVELRAGVERGEGEGIVLALAIRDTGIGIAAEDLPRLFEFFGRLESGLGRRYSGLGLGLATVHRLLELMGGEIRVQSEPGRGSLFALRIPLRVPVGSRETSHAPAVRESPRKNHRRILLVEDDPVAQRIVGHILERAGYQADAVGSGDAAIAVAGTRPYDLILMDLQIPGKDGIETTIEIRKMPGYSDTPVIALTAHTGEEFRTFVREQGLQGFLSKPVRSEELLVAVRQHLG